MLVGALIDWTFAAQRTRRAPMRWMLPLASGFIAGEALIVVVLSLLVTRSA